MVGVTKPQLPDGGANFTAKATQRLCDGMQLRRVFSYFNASSIGEWVNTTVKMYRGKEALVTQKATLPLPTHVGFIDAQESYWGAIELIQQHYSLNFNK
jgi:hypothetical protein